MKDETNVVDGMPVRSEKIEFDPSQLVACERCGRSNAPNRSECIYCGADLSIADVTGPELRFRDVESWEKAFNIILIGGDIHDAVTDPLPFDRELIKRAIDSPPAPLGRVAARTTAELLCRRLNDAKFISVVVSDEDLNAEQSPVRLRSLSVTGDSFVLTTFNTNDQIEFPAESMRLIVIGRLFEERFEQTLKKKRGGVKEIEGRNVSKDSAVVDVYFGEDRNGFRILESGFDFSSLGERKSFLAAQNIKALCELLRTSAPSAAVSEDYVSKRGTLERIWPSTMRNDSKGVQRAKFGLTVEKAEVSTNMVQFTKYSRLVRLTI